MSQPSGTSYQVPLQLRKMENLHIIFWLFKDIAWCMFYRPLGIAMIIPTIIIAVVITYRTRNNMSEWCHNFAVTAWIAANAYWMVTEFLHIDAKILTGSITFKHLAILPFGVGLAVLAYFYAYWKPKHPADPQTSVHTDARVLSPTTAS